MASLLAREEPLLKQLVRSRACKRRDPISAGFGPQIRNTRSFSQPPPRQREQAPQLQPAPGTLTPPNKFLVSPGSPGTTYTLQFLPYSLVCQASAMSSIIPVSLSQPDLRRCGAQSHSDLLGCLSPAAISSRCSSLSPVRCLSPAPAHMSPRNGSCFSSHAGTPARAVSPGPQSRPTTPTIIINSEELFYAGGSEYFTSDFLRANAFSQKLAGPNFGHKPGSCGWASPRDCASPSREDLGPGSMSANWEKSLEVERSEGRKYSLTDTFLFPHPDTVVIRERSPIRDGNNNNNYNQVGQQHRRPSRGENHCSSLCCCFNDLCCKICLVFNKEDSTLTLEQLQNRAIRNIMSQKNCVNGGSGGCKPKSMATERRGSPEPSLLPAPAKKKILESSKSKSGSR